MKIAAFNVENLFNRPRVFSLERQPAASKIIAAVMTLSSLFEKQVYSAGDRAQMLSLMKTLGILNRDDSEYVWLRKIRGQLIRRPKAGKPEIVATGRGDWIGWLEYKTNPVDEIAIHNTGRVIRDVAADILAVVEAENRVTLKLFSEAVLARVNKERDTSVIYDEVMLIDGNDDRGIDVGVMTRNGYRVHSVESHIHDRNRAGQRIFSRDCPVYAVSTPGEKSLCVIPNHFKSKFGGDSPEAIARRRQQALRVADIYRELVARGVHNIVILGDLNDTPESKALAPLLKDTDLKDVSLHPTFDPGEFEGIGTYGLGNDNNKIDYLLLSPALFAKITSCGLFRKGAWPGKKPRRWSVYEELDAPVHAASDHHLIWAEIDI